MKINILLCDTFQEYLPTGIASYSSMYINLFNAVNENLSYQVFDMRRQQFPSNHKQNEINLITGSSFGVHDNLPWVRGLISFIRYAHQKRIKFAGTCFGHQIIAEALGGKVERASNGWGAGVRTAQVVSPRALPHFPNGEFTLAYNHHDQVVELPAEAERFATSDFCENESFMIGDHILTFQGHPEYTTEFNRHLILNHSQKETEEARQKALSSMHDKATDNSKVASLILNMLA